MRPFDATRLPTVACGDNVTPSRMASKGQGTLMGQGMPEGQNQAVLNPESRSQGAQPQGGEPR